MKKKELDNLVDAYLWLHRSYDKIVGLPDADDETIRKIGNAKYACVIHKVAARET